MSPAARDTKVGRVSVGGPGGFAALLTLTAAISCSSARPDYPGVSYSPYRGAAIPLPTWQDGSWEDIPLVVTDRPVEWSEPHDTIAEIELHPATEQVVREWERRTGQREVTRDCRNFEIVVVDSLQPPIWVCRRWEDPPPRYTTQRRSVATDPTLLQKTAWQLGGHAVLLASVTARPLRGYVIRCPVFRGSPECR